MSGSSQFDRILTVMLMIRASFDPENACDGSFATVYRDLQDAAAPFDHGRFLAAASEARHRGLLDGTGAGASEEDLRGAVERLREALYLMTSLAAHFVATSAAATHREPLVLLDDLTMRLRATVADGMDAR
jgi:hypothetical protein